MMYGDAAVWRAWEGLEHSVRTAEASFSHVHGVPLFDYLAAHPTSAKHFDAAMVSSSNMLNAAIVDAYDWKQFGVLVDVGGGVGSTLAAILDATPNLNGILFDLPHVIERGRDFLAQRGLSDRCTTMPGSFFDSIPNAGDAYILKHILHDWGNEDCISILRACRNAMPDRAKLLGDAQRLLAEDSVHAFLYQPQWVTVANKNIRGLWKDMPLFVNDLSAMSWA